MKVLFTILCAINITYAQISIISVDGLNLSYNNPSGAARANHFIIPGYSLGNSPTFTVEQQAGSFILETENESLIIENVPEQILDLEKVVIKNFSLETNKSKIFLSVNKVFGNSIETNIDVKSIILDCQGGNAVKDLLDEVLNLCVNNFSQIKIERFTKDGRDILKNADLKLEQNNLKFKIKAAGYNVKGSGKGYYTPGLIRIKVEKAKVGIINVKNKLFKELEEIELSNIRVSKPWIEIDI